VLIGCTACQVRLAGVQKRSLVHFAVDPDVAYMTTQLQGRQTHFLPFNKGNGTAAGNAEVETGYKTSYLWEQVWEPQVPRDAGQDGKALRARAPARHAFPRNFSGRQLTS
jgi:hypothetical protein